MALLKDFISEIQQEHRNTEYYVNKLMTMT